MGLDAGTIYFMIPPEGATATGVSLASAADVGWIPVVPERLDIAEVGVLVTTAPTVTAPVLTLFRRPTPGSGTGEVSLGTITLPVATAIGKRVKKGFNARLNPGDQLRIAVTTAATAGAGLIYVKAYPGGSAALEADDVVSV
jgi:hypothetical protein